MSDHELAIAMTNLAIKHNLLLLNNGSLPFNGDGALSDEYMEQTASSIVRFYRIALKKIRDES